eukprot:Seg2734.3 transcript_id=Seg2734.3/GoldUCD/mRNA.D3Y31 product="hypothetical protein" protein_id=Seg2734.3/GoldUCD/D3Y31
MEERQKRNSKKGPQTVKCKEKYRGPLKDSIAYDLRAPFDRNGFSDAELNSIKQNLTQFECVAGKFITSDSEDDGFEDISEEEKAVIESATRDQGEFWKLQRKGFITSTKLKEAFTRQKAVDIDSTKTGHSVAKRLLETDSMRKYSKLPAQLQYGRDNESEARKEYKKLMTTTHSNSKLQTSGLQVCTKHPYIAASPDNIRSCKCCQKGIVEYKCPYKNRNKHPRAAFLDPSIGGTILEDEIELQNETVDTETTAEVEEMMEIDDTIMQENDIINVEEINDTRSFELITLQGVPLFKEDIESLSDGGWLTDNVIVMETRMLLQQRPVPANVQLWRQFYTFLCLET